MHTRVDRGTSSPLRSVAHASGDLTRLLKQPEVWRLSDREVTAGVEAAYRLLSQAHAAALTMLGELDSRGLAVEAGAPSTLQWLTASQRVRPEDAKRDVRLAQLLHRVATSVTDREDEADVPVEGVALRQGLTVGDVNVAQAGAISVALEELPEDASVSTRVLAERAVGASYSAAGAAPGPIVGHE